MGFFQKNFQGWVFTQISRNYSQDWIQFKSRFDIDTFISGSFFFWRKSNYTGNPVSWYLHSRLLKVKMNNGCLNGFSEVNGFSKVGLRMWHCLQAVFLCLPTVEILIERLHETRYILIVVLYLSHTFWWSFIFIARLNPGGYTTLNRAKTVLVRIRNKIDSIWSLRLFFSYQK